MLELLRQFSCRVRERLDFIFNSSFEAVCLFALFGIVVSVLLLHLHVKANPAAIDFNWWTRRAIPIRRLGQQRGIRCGE
jgi:hypothetical protein